MEEVMTAFKQVGYKLNLALHFILELLRLRFKLSESQYSIVKGLFAPDLILNYEEISWEEITQANIMHFMKTAIKKDASDRTSSA